MIRYKVLEQFFYKKEFKFCIFVEKLSNFIIFLKQFYFKFISDPEWFFPDPYPDLDPAKSFGSVSIYGSGATTLISAPLGPDPKDECMTMTLYLGEGAYAGGAVVANIVQNECMTMIFFSLGEGADAGGTVIADIVQNECMTMIFFYLGEGADAGGTVVANIVQNECMTMLFFYLGEGADAGGTVVANIVQNDHHRH
jgi:hypothetical protein